MIWLGDGGGGGGGVSLWVIKDVIWMCIKEAMICVGKFITTFINRSLNNVVLNVYREGFTTNVSSKIMLLECIIQSVG